MSILVSVPGAQKDDRSFHLGKLGFKGVFGDFGGKLGVFGDFAGAWSASRESTFWGSKSLEGSVRGDWGAAAFSLEGTCDICCGFVFSFFFKGSYLKENTPDKM